MSSTITVYAVSIDRLKRLIGSHEQSAIDAIVEEHGPFLSTIDDIDEEAEMTCADAVAELINGDVSDEGPGYFYGYGLEAICWHEGERLANFCGIAGASEWMEEVDAVLKNRGVALRLRDLVYAGSPVPIPEPDDYPFIGGWTADAIAGARAAFAAADLAPLEPDMRETLMAMQTWIDVAGKNPGTSLIGFLS